MSDSEWRFWDKVEGKFLYGLGKRAALFENPRYVAMRRLKSASTLGGELFDGDLVEVDSQAGLFRACGDGTFRGQSGETISLGDAHYRVLNQDPMDRHFIRPS